MIRASRATDRSDLRRLQSMLAEPSPALLTSALSAAPDERGDPFTLLVSTVTNGNAGPRSTASARRNRTTGVDALARRSTRPVGYLLAVGTAPTHLAELVVDPAYRRHGRASALLDALFQRVDGPVTLRVAPDNLPARTLYERHGFEVAERLPDGFESGAALSMVRG